MMLLSTVLAVVLVVLPMTSYCIINDSHPLHHHHHHHHHHHGYMLQIYMEDDGAIDDIVAMQDFLRLV